MVKYKKIKIISMLLMMLLFVSTSFSFFADSKENQLGYSIKGGVTPIMVMEFDTRLGESYPLIGRDTELFIYEGSYKDNQTNVSYQNKYLNKGVYGAESDLSKLDLPKGIITVVNYDKENWSPRNASDPVTNPGIIDVPLFNIPNLDVAPKSFYRLFYGATNFIGNPGMNNWDVSSIESFGDTFAKAEKFNQYIGDWDTSKSTRMVYMFYEASSFNQDLNKWDTSNVTDMRSMFRGAKSFNKPLWFNTTKVTNMSNMFDRATSFNQGLTFNTRNVTDISSMFEGATSFNKPVNFNTTKVTNMSSVFRGATSFNQTVNFDTVNVTNMQFMFSDARAFNKPLKFNTSNVINLGYIFNAASVFNQDISDWDVSKVVEKINWSQGSLIKDNIGFWPLPWQPPMVIYEVDTRLGDSRSKINLPKDPSIKVNIYSGNYLNNKNNIDNKILSGSTSHDIANYYTDLNNKTKGVYTIVYAGRFDHFGSSNFDRSIININELDLVRARVTSLSRMLYGAESFNQPLSLDTSNVKDMSRMFGRAESFNQPLSLDTSNVVDMSNMFNGANQFNQPLSLDTSNVKDMSYMFQSASLFNKDIGSWDVSNVTNMYGMFYGASSFNQDISLWDVSRVINNDNWNSRTRIKNKPEYWPKAWQPPTVIYEVDTSLGDAAIKIRSPEDTGVKVKIYKGDYLSNKYNVDHNILTGSTSHDIDSYDTDLNDKTKGNYTVVYNGKFEHFGSSGFASRDRSIMNIIELDLVRARVTSLSRMLYGASSFNQLAELDTSNITDMSWMFDGAKVFNQPINFNTSKVTDMVYMFGGASSFNQPLNFDTSNVVDMFGMFMGASSFNQPLKFNTDKVTDMGYMLRDATSFNQPLNLINTSNVTKMKYIFYGASSFSQDISSWDVSKVDSYEYWNFMSGVENKPEYWPKAWQSITVPSLPGTPFEDIELPTDDLGMVPEEVVEVEETLYTRTKRKLNELYVSLFERKDFDIIQKVRAKEK